MQSGNTSCTLNKIHSLECKPYEDKNKRSIINSTIRRTLCYGCIYPLYVFQQHKKTNERKFYIKIIK